MRLVFVRIARMYRMQSPPHSPLATSFHLPPLPIHNLLTIARPPTLAQYLPILPAPPLLPTPPDTSRCRRAGRAWRGPWRGRTAWQGSLRGRAARRGRAAWRGARRMALGPALGCSGDFGSALSGNWPRSGSPGHRFHGPSNWSWLAIAPHDTLRSCVGAV